MYFAAAPVRKKLPPDCPLPLHYNIGFCQNHDTPTAIPGESAKKGENNHHKDKSAKPVML